MPARLPQEHCPPTTRGHPASALFLPQPSTRRPARRVEDLFRDVLLHQRNGAGRYLLQIQQRIHLLDLTPGQIGYQSVNDRGALLELLGSEQPVFSHLALDRHALEGEDLALILPMGRPNSLQVFLSP